MQNRTKDLQFKPKNSASREKKKKKTAFAFLQFDWLFKASFET